MLDFTSALYLGLRHASASLPPWDQLTLGTPAALADPPGAAEVARAVAKLLGAESALLATSTLHAFWDVFGALPEGPVALYLDDGSYPIAQWAMQRVTARGVAVRRFPHHAPAQLARFVRRLPSTHRPVVVTDGYCPGCGRVAPLAAYLEVVRARGGWLVLDDSQAAGILGERDGSAPYGTGGGGSTRWTGVAGPDVLWCGSFAKAFGAPVAAVAGAAKCISRIRDRSETRVHCSPPSAAHLVALKTALEVNGHSGARLRRALADRVAYFRRGLERAGLSAAGGLFPMQRVLTPEGVDVRQLHQRLWEKGVRTVPQRSRCGPETSVAFVITARHTRRELERALAALESVIGQGRTTAFEQAAY